jgi:hypothetical protein
MIDEHAPCKVRIRIPLDFDMNQEPLRLAVFQLHLDQFVRLTAAAFRLRHDLLKLLVEKGDLPAEIHLPVHRWEIEVEELLGELLDDVLPAAVSVRACVSRLSHRSCLLSGTLTRMMTIAAWGKKQSLESFNRSQVGRFATPRGETQA